MLEWREVHLTDASYFVGRINGVKRITGFVVRRLDRGDFYLVQTAGHVAYLLPKSEERRLK